MTFKKSKEKSQEINKSTLLMSTGTFLSRICGFLRDMVIGYMFNRTETDAFFVAFRFPNFFRRFFGEGALTVSFVPVFIECLYKSNSEEQNIIQAKNLMNGIYTLLLITISILIVIGILAMEPLIHILFNNYEFSRIPGKMEMTIFLAQILFVYLFLITTYAYYTAISNALGHFFIPAAAPAVFNIFVILTALFIPQENFHYPTTVLALGVLIGGAAQALIVMFVLIKLKFLPRISLSFTSEKFKIVFQRFIPALVGVGGFALIGLLNVFFAGWLEEGAHTYIYYGDRLLEFPRSLISVSMGTALLPTLSKLNAQNKVQNLAELAAHQRDILLYIVLPCSMGLFILGAPCLETLFERGKFDALAVQQTGEILKIYSVLLVIISLTQTLSSCFYSVKNTTLPAITTLIGLFSHIIFALTLTSLYQLKGLIWATVASSSVQLGLLILFYPKVIGSLYLKRTFKRLIKVIPFVIVISFYVKYFYLTLLYFFNQRLQPDPSQAFALFSTIFSSMFIYGYISLKFNLIQAKEFMHLFQSQLKKLKR